MDWEEPWYADEECEEKGEVRIDFDAIKATTDAAHLIVVGDSEAWIPKSQIGELERTGGRFSSKGWLTIPEWLAVEKGLV